MDIRTTATGRPHGLRSLILALSLVLCAGFVRAQSGGVELNPSHPEEYVVNVRRLKVLDDRQNRLAPLLKAACESRADEVLGQLLADPTPSLAEPAAPHAALLAERLPPEALLSPLNFT